MTTIKQFSLEDFQTKFFKNVRFGWINYDLSLEELKDLYIDLKISVADKKPAYRRIQNNGKFYTAYNQLGRMIAQHEEYPINHPDIVNCEDVWTHRQLIFNDSHAARLMRKMEHQMAVRLGLKCFKNGKLYAASVKALNEFLYK